MRTAVYAIAIVLATASIVGVSFTENFHSSASPVWGDVRTGKVYAIYSTENYYAYWLTDPACNLADTVNVCYQTATVTTIGACGNLGVGSIMRWQESPTVSRVVQPEGCEVAPNS